MAEYFQSSVKDFLTKSADTIQSSLHNAYAADGFNSQYTAATKAWALTLEHLSDQLSRLVETQPDAKDWGLVLEYPLYRLRIRLDLVILSPKAIYVIELKTESTEYLAVDKKQVEEYALDLRDFHDGSHLHPLFPILWCPEKDDKADPYVFEIMDSVSSVICVGRENLIPAIISAEKKCPKNSDFLNFKDWLSASYRPVPSIITAATAIFSNHGVREISNFDADNLSIAGKELTRLIGTAKNNQQHYLVLLSGVPGSGKTLAGLNVVHDALEKKVLNAGEIVYLSGNTPLVTVLREALALDQVRQAKLNTPNHKITLKSARNYMRATIQHVMDFLNQYLKKESSSPPIDHVVIFDEAQRAWDKKQGEAKFNREASEPELILGIMERHQDWSVVIALIGIGQEINDGEYGLSGWGAALCSRLTEGSKKWIVFGSTSTLSGLELQPNRFPVENLVSSNKLHLNVPQRSYRAPDLSRWVDLLISGDEASAREVKKNLGQYPVKVTRSSNAMKNWLLSKARGQRRIGLLASSGAKRLRADGFGEFLMANSGASIAHWYLQPMGDIRSSNALEVPSNEYTSQGLEVDYAGLCWGGDLVRKSPSGKWSARKLSGDHWNLVKSDAGQGFIENSYRVLMTRAREGMIIWVPEGDISDKTRLPKDLDRVYSYLIECGAEIV
jgi:hypothetical protein